MKEGGGGGEGFLPFFPSPSPLTRAIFCAAFAPKEHGNACYAGYDLLEANNLTLSRFMMVNLYLMDGLVF